MKVVFSNPDFFKNTRLYTFFTASGDLFQPKDPIYSLEDANKLLDPDEKPRPVKFDIGSCNGCSKTLITFYDRHRNSIITALFYPKTLELAYRGADKQLHRAKLDDFDKLDLTLVQDELE